MQWFYHWSLQFVVFTSSTFMSGRGVMQEGRELRLRGRVWSQIERNIPKWRSWVGKQHEE